jgi:glycosyltransferase involved in cell wall biosynthesis
MRGGERVLEALCRMFPDADIFTNVFVPQAVSPIIRQHKVITTFVNRLPFVSRLYPLYLPLMPCALEQLDLRGYQLVISSESGPAKNVIVDPEAVHLCYCHSPMRYLWDQSGEYLRGKGVFTRTAISWTAHHLRMTDVTSAARVDGFIANSRFVAQRIKKYWRRDAEVIPPPVEFNRFTSSMRNEGYYLWLGQLVRYKRPDIAIEAFTRNGKPLIVAGDGPEMRKVRLRAGKNISFTGRVSHQDATKLLEGCRALVFPGVEDFGIVPVEAMACGKPVIAYRRGGVEDTVQDGVSGLFFDEASPESLIEAVQDFEEKEAQFSSSAIRACAERFTEKKFTERMWNEIKRYQKTTEDSQ